MPDLPGHLEGRSSFGGPVRGSYIKLAEVALGNLAANDDFLLKFVAPCDLRISEVSAATGAAITSDPVYTVSNTAGTVVATRTFPDNTTEVIAAASLTNREMLKGEVLSIQIAADGGDTAPEPVVSVWAWTKGHIAAADTGD